MNRRMRNHMYGGVRGRGLGAPSYSIDRFGSAFLVEECLYIT